MTNPLTAAEDAWRRAGVCVERHDNALVIAELALLEIYSDDPLADWEQLAESVTADWSVCAVVPARLVGQTRDALARLRRADVETQVQAWWIEGESVCFGSVESA